MCLLFLRDLAYLTKLRHSYELFTSNMNSSYMARCVAYSRISVNNVYIIAIVILCIAVFVEIYCIFSSNATVLFHCSEHINLLEIYVCWVTFLLSWSIISNNA